jgi:DNA-binding NtrC family response regulator
MFRQPETESAVRNAAMGHVLIVDDEPNAIKVLSAILSEEGYEISESKDVERAMKVIQKGNVDAIITDLKMPGKDGLYLFQNVNRNHSYVPVIFLTAYGTVESAVSAMSDGAFHYFIKPPDYAELKNVLARAVEQCRLKRELAAAKRMLYAAGPGEGRLVGVSSEIRRIFELIEAVKDTDSNVLICGDTGTGKELIATSLHYRSKRRDLPFIAVNCAAMPRELIESELFGYEKGAFTGAVERRVGRFEETSGGTLFLDEIGELELPLQAKLLRVLQEREIERLGSNRKVKVDFRLVCSTNRYIKREVSAKKFREDLFYRINVVQIKVPPLRYRKDDVAILVSEFLKEFCLREKKILSVSDDVMRIFRDYDWPGNVRQLRNIIERAVVCAKGNEITLEDIPQELFYVDRDNSVSPAGTLRETEFSAVKEAMQKCDGNKSKASKMLGISRKSLYKRLKEFSLILLFLVTYAAIFFTSLLSLPL